jgi:hypothetical protein
MTRVEGLLAHVCSERGWCLDADGYAQVRTAVPRGREAIADEIIRAELQIDPALCDTGTRRWLDAQVHDWLFLAFGSHSPSDGEMVADWWTT